MTIPVRPWSFLPELAVLTGTQAAAWDQRSIQGVGVPESALMERAGTAAARVAMELAPGGTVLVLAGGGNNGGDALVCGRCLQAWGREVEILSTVRGHRESPLLHGWEIPVRESAELSELELSSLIRRRGLLVDGLLGTGIRGAPRGEAARVIRAVGADAGDAFVLSLDIPSGVEADTGAAEAAIRAHATVAFGWPKLGSVLHPGRDRSGRLLVVEIGFPPLDAEARSGASLLLTPAWAAAHRPVRSPVTHKNQVGALAVVAGRPGMGGAALLAARSALRSGAGYVRIVTAPENREVVQAGLPEAVFVDATDPTAVHEALAQSRAVAAGPGMGTGDDAAELLSQVLQGERPAVVDADALTLAAGRPELLAALGRPGVVITPHPGEADRLLDGAPSTPLETLDALRERTGAVVLLKGTPSLVAGPAGRWISGVGSSDLAVAGMGDTLTGVVGSFLAQGVGAQEAAGLALIATARAADRAGTRAGLQSADVPEHLPEALEEGAGTTDLGLAGLLLDMDPPR